MATLPNRFLRQPTTVQQTGGLTRLQSNQFGEYQPLIGDLATQVVQPNRFLKQAWEIDPTKVQERLNQYAYLNPDQLSKISQLQGFNEIAPKATIGGNKVYEAAALRALLNRAAAPQPTPAAPAQPPAGVQPAPIGQPTPAVPAAPVGVQPTVPGAPVALDRGFVPPAVQQNPFGSAAYNPNAAVRTSKAGWDVYGGSDIGNMGFDTTGYLKAVNDYNNLIKAYGQSLAPQKIREMDREAYGGMSDAEIQEMRAGMQGSSERGDLARSRQFKQLEKSPAPELQAWTGLGLESFDPSKTFSWSQYVNDPKQQGRFESFEDYYNKQDKATQKQLAGMKEAYDRAAGLQSQFAEKYLPQTLNEQIRAHVKGGMDFQKAGIVGNNDLAANLLTASLADRGITDLRQIGFTTDPNTGKEAYYNKLTGEPISKGILNFKGGSGDGNMDIFLRHDDKGNVFLGSDFEAPEKGYGDYLMQYAPAIMGAMVAGPMGAQMGAAIGGTAAGSALGATGSALAGQAVAGGLTSGTLSAMQGGDFGQGFLSGAAGGLAGGVGGANLAGDILGANAPAWQTAALNAGLSGATRGGLQSALQGGNILEGALTGGLTGAVGGGLSGLGKGLGGIGKLGTQALSGGLQSAIRGEDFGTGATSGLVGGLTNAAIGGLSDLAGLDPSTQKLLSGVTAPVLRGAMARKLGRRT